MATTSKTKNAKQFTTMIKILTTKQYRLLLAEIDELRRQLVEENRAKNAALRRLAKAVEVKPKERKTKNKTRL